MPIEVQCAACGKKLRAPDNQAGRMGKCPACKSDIVVPGRPVATTAAPAAMAASAPNARTPQYVSPLASTMDEDFALPPQANSPSSFGSGQFSAPEENAAAIGPKHWFALQIVLKVTEIALLVEWISCAILGLGMIALLLMASSSSFGDPATMRVVMMLTMWGMVGVVLGWSALATGWITALLAWPKDRRLLMGAAISAGVAVFIILFILSLQMLGAFGSGPARGGPAGAPVQNTTAIILGSLAATTSLIFFNFFLTNVQRQLGREQVGLQPVIYAAVIGILTLWCLITNLLITPSGRFMMWVIVLSNVGTLVGEFLWLWLINAFTSRDLRVSHAWKRL